MKGLDQPAAVALSNLKELTDEEVVAQVRTGNAALFEILMRRHNQRVYRAARAILGNDAEAEDVMQEAYVRAFTHLDQFENRAKFSTWVTKIAVHEALARVRKSKRWESLDSEADTDVRVRPEPMSNARNPEEQMFGAQMKTLLETSLDALPDKYRTVFVLREIEEMSTTETAEALGITEEAVKTRLHRARAMLQTDLCSRAGASTPDAFEFHLSRCDRVVNAVLARILTSSSSPRLVQ
jgi:RNA polymerase sigma-70 factor (ECF subfamily)